MSCGVFKFFVRPCLMIIQMGHQVLSQCPLSLTNLLVPKSPIYWCPCHQYTGAHVTNLLVPKSPSLSLSPMLCNGAPLHVPRHDQNKTQTDWFKRFWRFWSDNYPAARASSPSALRFLRPNRQLPPSSSKLHRFTAVTHSTPFIPFYTILRHFTPFYTIYTILHYSSPFCTILDHFAVYSSDTFYTSPRV